MGFSESFYLWLRLYHELAPFGELYVLNWIEYSQVRSDESVSILDAYINSGGYIYFSIHESLIYI